MNVDEVISLFFDPNGGAGTEEIKIWVGEDPSLTNLVIEAYILNPSDVH
jgi:hypothetical protein